MPSLQSIRYTAGSLELLEQRLLPNETVYMKIKNVDDCHKARSDFFLLKLFCDEFG